MYQKVELIWRREKRGGGKSEDICMRKAITKPNIGFFFSNLTPMAYCVDLKSSGDNISSRSPTEDFAEQDETV